MLDFRFSLRKRGSAEVAKGRSAILCFSPAFTHRWEPGYHRNTLAIYSWLDRSEGPGPDSNMDMDRREPNAPAEIQ